MVRFDVDIRRLRKKIESLSRGFDGASDEALKLTGSVAKTYARAIAPKDTGRTIQGISLMGVKSRSITLIAKNPTASDGFKRGPLSNPYRTRGKFNLVKWMHESPRAPAHIKTGEPRFMYLTADFVRQFAPGQVQESFNKVIIKNK